MSIRTKLLVVALAVSTAFSAASVLMQRALMLPEFDRIEQERAVEGIERCRYAVQRDAEFLAAMAADYAAWDDTYQFVQDKNQAYIDANLVPETFKNLRANLIAIVSRDGTLVFGEIREKDGGDVIASEAVFAELARADHVLIRHESPNARIAGVLQTPMGPMLIGSAALTTSKRDGEVRGSVIMGRLADDATAQEIAAATRVESRLRPIAELSVKEHTALARCMGERQTWSDRSSDAQIVSHGTILDVFEQPALLLTTVMPRTISNRAAIASQSTMILAIAGGAVMLAVLWFAIYRTVVEPLARLSAHAVRVGRESDLSARLNDESPSEIGILSREFDRMVDRLAQTQAQLLDIAHKAGKSQVAVDVLHNVGNVLNSVTVSANLVQGKLRDSEVRTVGMAAELLQEHKSDLARFMSDDDRGKQLPDSLGQLSRHLSAEQEAMMQEMTTVAHAIEHIRDIVTSQQRHNPAQRLIERMSVPRLIGDAVALGANSLQRHEIELTCAHDGDEYAALDKHRMMQILVNLISNAQHALRDKPDGTRTIEICSAVTRSDGGGLLTIRVRDNGMGIDPADQQKIFAMGYSTRDDGTGVGLHSAANMAAEMGGTLRVASAGVGHGSEFTLTFSLTAEQVQA
ncbi:MAG: CHASE4 domain-containing protein [Phycisphaerae bacterium]